MGNNLEIKTLKVKDIHPYKRNPRKNDQAVDAVMESIRQCGYCAPIVVDEDHEVLAGHTRLKAVKKLGWDECEVVIKEGLTEEQKRKYRLLDNKTNELAEWDMELLEIELDGLDFEGFEFGFDDKEDDYSDAQTKFEQDAIPDVQEETISKRGDIWQLGRHRLMCGDSTDENDIAQLMDGEKAAMLFTSPPYSDMREYEGGKDLSVDYLAQFIAKYRPWTDYQCVNLGIQRKDNDIYEYWNEYIRIARESGYKMLAWNVWDKTRPGSIGNQSAFFPIRHEWIFVFGTEFYEINLTWEKAEVSIKSGTKQRAVRQADGKMEYSSTGDLSKPFKQAESVITIPQEMGKIIGEHPATFPVDLPGEYIKAMTHKDDIVIEPFGGSGTTLIACEVLNRNCRVMELEPKYVDVIIQRWENFTGGKAVLING